MIHTLLPPHILHDACGTGLIAAIDGTPSRRVVALGIEALKSLWHRGAVDADGKTGDGAGLHLQVPTAFFEDWLRQTGRTQTTGTLAVGMIFLPRKDLSEQEYCRTVVESVCVRRGLKVYGWRQVPVDVAVLGAKAAEGRPEIQQIILSHPTLTDVEALERELYVVRRMIEHEIGRMGQKDFYICSFSSRSLIYKGMFLAESLTGFYPDLLDARFTSAFAIFHQRYSTNTFPAWRLAQPFRMMAHNGEINTLKANMLWMRAHEARLHSPLFGDDIDHLRPVIQPGGSDSAALDNAMELLARAGRPLPLVKALLIPEAWSTGDPTMPEAVKALYSYSNSVTEPWDGPAALVGTDGVWVMAGMDRNGLRPFRYVVTVDGLVMGGSEVGLVPLPTGQVIEKGRLGPGGLLAVNLAEGKLYRNAELKQYLAARHPYQDWVQRTVSIPPAPTTTRQPLAGDDLLQRQLAAGWTLEELELILHPMATTGKEAIGSMGDDGPLAVLASKWRGLPHFLRQNFSQVTNPPIDSLREARVMSLATRLGNLGNILQEQARQCDLVELPSPFLTTAALAGFRQEFADDVRVFDCVFNIHGDTAPTLTDALTRLREDAATAARQGARFLLLSDRAVTEACAAMPMVLAVSAVHSDLLRQGLRSDVSLIVEAAECLDPHSAAMLISCGATLVCPWLAEETLATRHARGLCAGLTLEQAVRNHHTALEQGLLKIMSKLGISVISSYRGGYNFEALGLSRALMAEYFPGVPSRLSGIGLVEMEHRITEVHRMAYAEEAVPLPVGGFYRQRANSEHHAWEGQLVHLLQTAVGRDSYQLFRQYAAGIHSGPPLNVRDLLDFHAPETGIHLDTVEPLTRIRQRFVTPGMSLGALSPEAHGTLNIAMNRIGAKSDSGEGGEDPDRYHPQPNGDNANSAIKQVASGRFGVTAEYLNQCREIEIKVAQGAKPGEGGQLPGFKVTAEIARLRHATAGVMLISPPPHHDIYSIEDLAQLIYDLKQINPDARVCVKLVARSGIGAIAAGVAKAGADVILISGHSGGTGASPLTSIKFAGLPWEMGLSEAHQTLMLNGLRHRVVLRTDGGIKTGRDVVMAAMLGAEEYGIGTASLVAMGCLIVRQCHSNTCPVGICTQDPELRKKFDGTPEKVVNLFSFIADDTREVLARLGFATLEEAIGRTDLLRQVQADVPGLDALDLNPILARPQDGGAVRCTLTERNPVPDTLDATILADAQPFFAEGRRMQLAYSVRNTHRAIGARVSAHIVRQYGMKHFADDHLTVRLRGSAGQSLGAFAVHGLTLEVFGDANDYIGKGLSGAVLVVRPRVASRIQDTQNHTIIGNTALYGATAGKLFAAGQAGERFAVRNSGACTVIEGCGANGCEYMTGGVAVILGPVGHNFAAGMTGGVACVYDPAEVLPHYLNDDSVVLMGLAEAGGTVEQQIYDLIQEHVTRTGSTHATALLEGWAGLRQTLRVVMPREILAQRGKLTA
jgi:glutamate synthase (NADPH) large chain